MARSLDYTLGIYHHFSEKESGGSFSSPRRSDVVEKKATMQFLS